MNQQLKALMEKRAYSERKTLYAELQNVRTSATAAGQFTSSRRILAAMGAGAQTITTYCDGAVDDYEKVVNSYHGRFKSDKLHNLQKQFTQRLRDERREIDRIMEAEVGGIATHLDPKGLMRFTQIAEAFVPAFDDAQARAVLHNELVLQGAPSLTATLKSKWENNKLAVAGSFLLLAVVGVAAKGKDILEFFEKVTPLLK